MSRLAPSTGNRRASHSLFDNVAPEKLLHVNAFVPKNLKELHLGAEDDDDYDDGAPFFGSAGSTRQLPSFSSGSDYYCRPSMEELREMAASGRSLVINKFTVGKPNVGEITFQGQVDLTSLADQYLDDIIQFAPASVAVYDGRKVPPRGQGLNVPAKILLYNVATPKRYARNVKRFQEKLEAIVSNWGPHIKLQSYDPATSTVKLRADYFE